MDPKRWVDYTFPRTGPLQFRYGLVMSALVNFLAIGFVAWQASKLFLREKPGAKPATKACPACFMGDLDMRATRCPHCTSDVAA